MGFWFYMFLTTLLIPGVMIFFGYRFQLKGAPKKINRIYGYRTSRAMKNRETWEFAHRRLGVYWSRMGWPALVMALVFMPCAAGKDAETVSVAGTVLVMVQLMIMCAVLIPTERALKREFDENGNRIG